MDNNLNLNSTTKYYTSDEIFKDGKWKLTAKIFYDKDSFELWKNQDDTPDRKNFSYTIQTPDAKFSELVYVGISNDITKKLGGFGISPTETD